MNKSRPSWEEYALLLAYAARSRSEDPYEQVGAAVLRPDHSTASTGYNGAPAGVVIDWTDRDDRRPYVIHAERNACNYIKPGECELIASTLLPCPDCLKEIAIKGITSVVYSELEPAKLWEKQSRAIAKLYGINLIYMPIDYQEKNLPKFGWQIFAIVHRCASIITHIRKFLHI